MLDETQLMSGPQILPKTHTEHLTQQFYKWEKRGRGWSVWDYQVELEPPFEPFFLHFIPNTPLLPESLDDTRRPTFLSALCEKIKSILKRPTAPVVSEVHTTPAPSAPEPFYEDSSLLEFQVTLPSNLPVSKETAERFLLSLAYCSKPISFELVGTQDALWTQFSCRTENRSQVFQQLRAYFPDAVISEDIQPLSARWVTADPSEMVIADFGLSQEFMLPLKSFKSFEVDPLIAFAGPLSDLNEGEIAVFQVIFQPALYSWAESIMRAVTDGEGRAFFMDAPEMVSLAKQKISKPLFCAVIRIAAKSWTQGEAWEISRALGGASAQFGNPSSNELIPLTNDAYAEEDHEYDLLYRLSHRTGMLLNSEELVSLVHLPSLSVRSEKFKREEKKTKSAPASAQGNAFLLGENLHRGHTERVGLSQEQRIRHTYVIGASGTGKSTLLLNMIRQDITHGEGVGILDPHGDLIEKILECIPDERFQDVVLFDPSDEDFPIGFNILSAHSELEKTLLASDLVGIFRRFSTSWGDQMNSVLANAILAFLESKEGGTLAHLRRFLVEDHYRHTFLESVRDSEVLYYWQKEFPLLSGKPQAPLLTRLDTFLRPKLIRRMIAQKENRIDFGHIMDSQKIFLAKLAHGGIGEENAYLLGSLIVSKLHQMAMGRQAVTESERKPFYLYIDEFQNFVTPSMASILSGARKYRLALIIAHQELRQLWNRDADVGSAVLSNPCTRICFRLGDFDAQKLANGFSFFDQRDLQNLATGEAICRIDRAEYDFNLHALPLPAVDTEGTKRRRSSIVELSRQRYGRSRQEVECELAEEFGLPSSPETSPKKLSRESRREPPSPGHPGEPVRRIMKEPTPPVRREAVPLGRGGNHHKYLQDLIKRLGESKGYRGVIEKQILDGKGGVDVSLEKEGSKLACEISVTSTGDQELGNIQKCLAGGYDKVILLSDEKKTLKLVRALVTSKLEPNLLEKVSFLEPQDFPTFLEHLEAQGSSKEELVRGYKVKVNYRTMEPEEKKSRREAVSQVILEALRRLKGK